MKPVYRLLLGAGLLLFLSRSSFSQERDSLYHPFAPARADIAAAVKTARTTHRHVLIQVGGNWCSWCLLLQHFWTSDPILDSVLKADYVLYHLNYSKENENLPLLAQYGFPQRFGFPVLLVLDGKGRLIHTQNTGLLEQGRGYNREKVLETLEQWSPEAIDPATYREK
ncbi:MAG TPA: thioredoxin family protein [Chitinophagaceae bacterium]|nr:thioredoxin family protein [Chitinophagaceae bacterium]